MITINWRHHGCNTGQLKANLNSAIQVTEQDAAKLMGTGHPLRVVSANVWVRADWDGSPNRPGKHAMITKDARSRPWTRTYQDPSSGR